MIEGRLEAESRCQKCLAIIKGESQAITYRNAVYGSVRTVLWEDGG